MTAGHTVSVAILAASIAVAGSPSPASPASPASSAQPDPDLMAQAQERLDTDLAARDAVTVTDAMRAAATLDLDPADATFAFDAAAATWDLRPDDATTTLESRVEDAGRTTVRLTADLLFDFGSATLTAPAAAAVTRLAADIPQGAAVAVDGHTDSIGDEAFNDQLSAQRADAVAAALTASRPDLVLTVTGHGEREPVADNEVDGVDNPAGRAMNRRVEVAYG